MSNTIEAKDVDTTKQKQTEEIRVEVVQEEDTDEILSMLKTYFFKVIEIGANGCERINCLFSNN